MTQSSTNQIAAEASGSFANATGEHWYDMTATLSRDARDEFGDWLDEKLEAFEIELWCFSSARSLQNVKSNR